MDSEDILVGKTAILLYINQFMSTPMNITSVNRALETGELPSGKINGRAMASKKLLRAALARRLGLPVEEPGR